MKTIVRIANLLMVIVFALAMTSCEKVMHGNMLEKTSWSQTRNVEYIGEDGSRHCGTKTFSLHFESPTKGKLITVFVKGAETEETSDAFKYTFMDSMISGTITISDGEYAGKYNVAYSHCDETIVLYSDSGTLSGAFAKE
ncbi:MAG: hypothetical protein K6E73_11020 [Bacteroidales bacterium]|nr:hypothetical protein [Bacteroidales bacterium]